MKCIINSKGGRISIAVSHHPLQLLHRLTQYRYFKEKSISNSDMLNTVVVDGDDKTT